MGYGPSKDVIDYSALADGKHPWGNFRINSGKNPFKSIAVRFPTYGFQHKNPETWRAYLIKELSKVAGGLDGMTL